MSNLLNALNEQTSNGTNQTTPADSGNISAEKTWFSDVSVKGLISLKEVQEAIRRYVNLPTGPLIVKKAKKPYENKDTKDKTQKIEVLSGTDVYNAVTFELTLLNTEIDPITAINKKYRLIDYKFALNANMSDKKFSGYAATGLKVMVTKLEEVK